MALPVRRCIHKLRKHTDSHSITALYSPVLFITPPEQLLAQTAVYLLPLTARRRRYAGVVQRSRRERLFLE